mmetsp:Transcript_16188/g.33736  ORF Transcript_16188/g.33736 Transcript_16188/m.33736 type:complete len:207 (-) Transcript_16188:9-629(-)
MSSSAINVGAGVVDMVKTRVVKSVLLAPVLLSRASSASAGPGLRPGPGLRLLSLGSPALCTSAWLLAVLLEEQLPNAWGQVRGPGVLLQQRLRLALQPRAACCHLLLRALLPLVQPVPHSAAGQAQELPLGSHPLRAALRLAPAEAAQGLAPRVLLAVQVDEVLLCPQHLVCQGLYPQQPPPVKHPTLSPAVLAHHQPAPLRRIAS